MNISQLQKHMLPGNKILRWVLGSILVYVGVVVVHFIIGLLSVMLDDYPLRAPIIEGDLKEVKRLINKGEDVNECDSSGIPPLHLAAMLGRFQIVELLIIKGANVNAMDLGNSTALHEAARGGHIKTITILLMNGARADIKNKRGQTMLHAVASYRNANSKLVPLFVENGCDVNIIDEDGNTAISIAVPQYGNTAFIESLLREGAIINHGKKDDLSVAIRQGTGKMVKLLLKHGANIERKNKRGATPLFAAIQSNRPKMCKLLIGNGANINSQDINMKTPLHQAAAEGKEEIVLLLLKNGADANITDKFGEKPNIQRYVDGDTEK